jgi:hypothetical protein
LLHTTTSSLARASLYAGSEAGMLDPTEGETVLLQFAVAGLGSGREGREAAVQGARPRDGLLEEAHGPEGGCHVAPEGASTTTSGLTWCLEGWIRPREGP